MFKLTLRTLPVKRGNFRFFSHMKIPLIDKQLITHVGRGEQDDAEITIRKNPKLLLQSFDVTDYSGRMFKKITPFQLSLWALDWHMWEMILRYLPEDEAKKQLIHLETNQTEHGVHYDVTELIHALEVYLDNFNTWSCEQLGIQWCKIIGQKQTLVPAHVAQQLCHPYRSLDPLPNFHDPIFPRTFNLVDGSAFFPLESYPAGTLGQHFAVFRWNKQAAGIGTMAPCPNARITAITDLKGLKHLMDTRRQQYEDLKTTLLNQPSLNASK